MIIAGLLLLVAVPVRGKRPQSTTPTPPPGLETFMGGSELAGYARAYDRWIETEGQAEVDRAATFVGFVMGVADMATAIHSVLGGNIGLCPLGSGPQDGVTVAQACAVVAKYVRDSPEEWTHPGITLVVSALKKASPCPVKKR